MDAYRLDLFLRKTVRLPNGCLQWTGSTVRNDAKMSGPYGNFYSGKGNKLVHRLAYEHFIGSIPEGMMIDHLCKNTLCVEPTHLEPVTNQVNQRRGLRCDPSLSETRSRRTREAWAKRRGA